MKPENHHKAAERHLSNATSLVVQAKAAVGYAWERNAQAAAFHEAEIEYHRDRHGETVARQQEIARLADSLDSA